MHAPRSQPFAHAPHTLPASCRFAPVSGEYLLTASFDSTVRAWSTRDWSPISTLAGHDGKITGVDIFPDERRIVTASFDRTFKTWACS